MSGAVFQQGRTQMRELAKEELSHVYGAGSPHYGKKHDHKGGSRSKGKSHSRHASRSNRRSKSKGKKYCAKKSGARAVCRRSAATKKHKRDCSSSPSASLRRTV